MFVGIKSIGGTISFVSIKNRLAILPTEKTNNMLHRFLPKKYPLNNVSEEQLCDIQKKLNNLPRKCLGFRTAKEAFFEELGKVVALQY